MVEHCEGDLDEGKSEEAVLVSEGKYIERSPNGFLILEHSNYPS